MLILKLSHRFYRLARKPVLNLNDYVSDHVPIAHRSYSSTADMIAPNLVKTITVRTCVGDVFDRLRLIQPKLYKNSPNQGVDITIDYVDTGENGKQFDKTIVAVHGTADSYNTFNRMIQHFQSTNVRVIVPNMPDFGHTRSTNFQYWHSTLEKYHLLKDFLHKLQVNKVDCLIGHSLGIQPCSALLETPDGIQIKSMGIVAPQYLLESFPPVMVRIAKIIMLFKSELGTRFLNAIKLHQTRFAPFKFTNMDQFFLLNCCVYDTQVPLHDAVERIKLMAKLQTPGVILFGTDEKMITKYSIDRLHQLLNITDKILIKEDDPKLVPSLPNKGITSFLFENAGHFPHAKYSKVTNRLIEKLIEQP